MGLGAVGVVDGTLAHELLVERVVLGGRRVVAQLLVLDHHVAHVDPEPRHAAVPPEAHDVVELAPHLLVPPVQVRLRRLEVVQEVLAAGLVEVPGRAAEDAGPVVGQPTVGLGVGPDVVVPVGRVTPAQGIDEPGMLIAGVVGHQVHQDADAPLAGLADQGVEVVEGPEGGVDVPVVRDVVAPVAVGRAGHRRQPHGGDAEPRQVVELGHDAGQVAHAVAVGVGVGAGVDLVEDAAVPPAVGVALRVGWRHGASLRLVAVARERIDTPPAPRARPPLTAVGPPPP